MAKENTVVMRVNKDFLKWMQDISIERVKNGVEKKTIAPAEITRMTLNTESKANLFKELTTKPRKTNQW